MGASLSTEMHPWQPARRARYLRVVDLLVHREPDVARWERRDFSPGAGDGPRAGDHRDEFRREVGVERPGTPLARLGRPLLRRVQVDASRRALDHLALVARGPASDATRRRS